MSDLNLGQGVFLVTIVSVVLLLSLIGFTYAKNQLTKSLAGRFLLIVAIGLVASLFPMGPLGLFFGFPSVLISAGIITYIFRKELA